jgi:hypothetical protein
MLSLEDFIILALKLPPHVAIHFSGMSEPFSNPRCIDMILFAADLPNPISIYTTLSGLNMESADALFPLLESSRFDEFVIHLPDASGNMPGFKLDDAYIRNLSLLLRSQYVSCMTMSKTAEVDPAVVSLLRKASPASLKKMPRKPFVGWTRAGNLNLFKVGDQPVNHLVRWSSPISCASTPFYDHNVLLPNGNIALCCMDYGLKHIIGNLFEVDYYDLFASPVIAGVRAANMSIDKPRKDCSLCTSCDNVIRYEPKGSRWIPVNPVISIRSLPNYLFKRFLPSSFKRLLSKLQANGPLEGL